MIFTCTYILPQDKCSRYWPAQGSKMYGKLEVTVVEQEYKEDMICTNMQIAHSEVSDVIAGLIHTL